MLAPVLLSYRRGRAMKVFLTLISLFLLSSISRVQAQEVPPFANITSVDYRGSGCDAESARVSITSDLSYFSVLYDRFSVEVGPGTANPNANVQQKNCVIVVKFDLPPGWSLQFDEVEYRGFVSLPNANNTAHQMISVETPAGKGKSFQENTMRGPKMENFVTVYKNAVENSNGPKGKGPGGGGPPGRLRKGDYFDCSDRVQQAVLKIKSRIGVKSAGDRTNPTLKMIVDSTDASFNQKLKINWNKCGA